METPEQAHEEFILLKVIQNFDSLSKSGKQFGERFCQKIIRESG